MALVRLCLTINNRSIACAENATPATKTRLSNNGKVASKYFRTVRKKLKRKKMCIFQKKCFFQETWNHSFEVILQSDYYVSTRYFFLSNPFWGISRGGDQKWKDRHALATVHYRVISLMSRSSALDGCAAMQYEQKLNICLYNTKLKFKSLMRHIKRRRSKVEGLSCFGNFHLLRNFSHQACFMAVPRKPENLFE